MEGKEQVHDNDDDDDVVDGAEMFDISMEAVKEVDL